MNNQPDVRLQMNKITTRFAPEVDHLLEGYEVILENQAHGPMVDIPSPRKPISIHSVGISPFGRRPIDLQNARRFIDAHKEWNFDLFSIHLAKAELAGIATDRLIPVPYTQENIELAAEQIIEIRKVLGVPVLVENVAEYYTNIDSRMSASNFLADLAAATGCWVLFDVNNHIVNETNFGPQPGSWERLIAGGVVRELHLAGHRLIGEHAVDSHDEAVSDLALTIASSVSRCAPGPLTVVLERDANVQQAEILMDELVRIRTAIGA